MAMEKAVKAKNKFLMLLPKAAYSAVTFQKPPFSPNREIKRLENATKLKSHIGKGYPAPIRSFIPAEARRKSKNSIQEEEEEPTSPKVSCMGQIKHKHNQQKHQKEKKKKKKKIKKIKKALSLPKDININKSVCDEEAKKKKQMKNIGKIFGGLKLKPGRKSDVTGSALESQLSEERAPSLSQMKRFASSRDHFSNFDWKIAPVGIETDHIHTDIDDYYSDDQESEEEEEEEEFRIPFSAPILLVSTTNRNIGDIAMEPRKEVNLWKRRTMAQPRPLQLKPPFLSN